MKVFISWSGERSKQVAEYLSGWMKMVIQAIDPWMSSKHIDRGSLWFSEINEILATTSVGIICLTNENKNKPWVLFESGALAKGLTSNRVCTFLIDLQPTDLDNPLAQFNHTSPDKPGLRNLLSTINATLNESRLPENVLDEVFEIFYPIFEKRFKEILAATLKEEVLPVSRPEPELLTEILATVRNLDKRMRNVETENVENFKSRLAIESNRNYKRHLGDNYTPSEYKDNLMPDDISAGRIGTLDQIRTKYKDQL